MPKYLCLQRSLPTSEGPVPSPEEMQQMYARFNEWREKFRENLVDPGGRLADGKLVTAAAQTDSPLTEVRELVGGYMLLEASDLEAAISVARECPGLVRPGSGVEVIEVKGP